MDVVVGLLQLVAYRRARGSFDFRLKADLLRFDDNLFDREEPRARKLRKC